MSEQEGFCVSCCERVSVSETRTTGRCPACGDDMPMLVDQQPVSVR